MKKLIIFLLFSINIYAQPIQFVPGFQFNYQYFTKVSNGVIITDVKTETIFMFFDAQKFIKDRIPNGSQMIVIQGITSGDNFALVLDPFKLINDNYKSSWFLTKGSILAGEESSELNIKHEITLAWFPSDNKIMLILDKDVLLIDNIKNIDSIAKNYLVYYTL